MSKLYSLFLRNRYLSIAFLTLLILTATIGCFYLVEGRSRGFDFEFSDDTLVVRLDPNASQEERDDLLSALKADSIIIADDEFIEYFVNQNPESDVVIEVGDVVVSLSEGVSLDEGVMLENDFIVGVGTVSEGLRLAAVSGLEPNYTVYEIGAPCKLKYSQEEFNLDMQNQLNHHHYNKAGKAIDIGGYGLPNNSAKLVCDKINPDDEFNYGLASVKGRAYLLENDPSNTIDVLSENKEIFVRTLHYDVVSEDIVVGGTDVDRGHLLGVIGEKGNATFKHIHMEVWNQIDKSTYDTTISVKSKIFPAESKEIYDNKVAGLPTSEERLIAGRFCQWNTDISKRTCFIKEIYSGYYGMGFHITSLPNTEEFGPFWKVGGRFQINSPEYSYNDLHQTQTIKENIKVGEEQKLEFQAQNTGSKIWFSEDYPMDDTDKKYGVQKVRIGVVEDNDSKFNKYELIQKLDPISGEPLFDPGTGNPIMEHVRNGWMATNRIEIDQAKSGSVICGAYPGNDQELQSQKNALVVEIQTMEGNLDHHYGILQTKGELDGINIPNEGYCSECEEELKSMSDQEIEDSADPDGIRTAIGLINDKNSKKDELPEIDAELTEIQDIYDICGGSDEGLYNETAYFTAPFVAPNDVFAVEEWDIVAEGVTRMSGNKYELKMVTCGENSSSAFCDIETDSMIVDAATALYEAGISGGCAKQNNEDGGNRAFCPEEDITRTEMATMISRWIYNANEKEDEFGQGDLHLYSSWLPEMKDPAIFADYGTGEKRIHDSEITYIEMLFRDGVISGEVNPDNNSQRLFKPKDPVNRGQAMKMVVNSFMSPQEIIHYDISEVESFPDVNHQTTFNREIHIAKSLGLVNGFSDGQFKPEEQITRGEMATILCRAYLFGETIDGNVITSCSDGDNADLISNVKSDYRPNLPRNFKTDELGNNIPDGNGEEENFCYTSSQLAYKSGALSTVNATGPNQGPGDVERYANGLPICYFRTDEGKNDIHHVHPDVLAFDRLGEFTDSGDDGGPTDLSSEFTGIDIKMSNNLNKDYVDIIKLKNKYPGKWAYTVGDFDYFYLISNEDPKNEFYVEMKFNLDEGVNASSVNLSYTQDVTKNTSETRNVVDTTVEGNSIVVNSDHFSNWYLGSSLPDVLPTHTFYNEILKLYRAGITHGYSDGTYKPDQDITRAELGLMLLRSKNYADSGELGIYYKAPTSGQQIFADVPQSHQFFSEINELYNQGITTGSDDCRPIDAPAAVKYFCPDDVVNRADMAIFITRILGGDVETSMGVFDDVPNTDPHSDEIENLYWRGIIDGCTQTPMKYCPADNVTRGQVSKYLVKAFIDETASRSKPLFLDVDTDYWAFEYINELSNAGITKGCDSNKSLFCAEDITKRQDMAVLMLRARYYMDTGNPGYEYDDDIPKATQQIFSDVPLSHPYVDYINHLYEEGITTGCSQNPRKYCPDEEVNRIQAAYFIMRTLESPDYVANHMPSAQGIFEDMPRTHDHAQVAEEMYRRGITSGCSSNELKYCPDEDSSGDEGLLKRSHMAVFLSRAFVNKRITPDLSGINYGDFCFSTHSGFDLPADIEDGYVEVENGDVVCYYKDTDTYRVVFREEMHDFNDNIDALDINDDGEIWFSLSGTEDLPGLKVYDGDVVSWNGVKFTKEINSFSSNFSEFEDEDIDGLYDRDGSASNFYISTNGRADFDNNLRVENEDIANLHIGNGNGEILFDGSNWGLDDQDIESVSFIGEDIYFTIDKGKCFENTNFCATNRSIIRFRPSTNQFGICLDDEDFPGDVVTIDALHMNNGIECNKPIKHAPVITSTPELVAPATVEYQYQIEATDADGDDLSYWIGSTAQPATISDTGLIKWTPTEDLVGSTKRITYTVSDGSYSVTNSFDLSVELPPKPAFDGPDEIVLGDFSGGTTVGSRYIDDWYINSGMKYVKVDLNKGISYFGRASDVANSTYIRNESFVLDAEEYRYISLTVEVSGSASIGFDFRSDTYPYYGSNHYRITPINDGQMHTYLVDLWEFEEWDRMVDGIKLYIPSSRNNDIVGVKDIKLIHKDAIDDPELTDLVWDFEGEGWLNNRPVWKGPITTNQLNWLGPVEGGYKYATKSSDPWINGYSFNIEADDYKYVEVEMSTTADACGQIYFRTGASGFSEGTRLNFTPVNDGQMHKYIIPTSSSTGWTGIVQQLRLDPACNPVAGSEIVVKKIAIRKDIQPSGLKYDFTYTDNMWDQANVIRLIGTSNEGVEYKVTGGDPILKTPMLSLPADDYSEIKVEMATYNHVAQVFFVRYDMPAWSSGMRYDMPTINDGQMHTYTIDLTSHPLWDKNITQIRFDPVWTQGGDNRVVIKSFEVVASEYEFSCDSVVGVSQGECEVLVDLYDSTNGDQWSNNDGWKESPIVCDWFGITCNANRVFWVYLMNNNLEGELPKSLGGLINVRHLKFNDNKLSGEIPSSIGNIRYLDILQMHNNELSGAIPVEIGNTSVNHILLQGNNLSGSIPRKLTSRTDLYQLQLQHNQLTGEIPIELAELTNIKYLFLDNNELSGSIPTGFGGDTGMLYFYVQRNKLSGTIPADLGNLSNLIGLSLSHNQLSGEIPASLGGMTDLQNLYLGNNGLSGEIPVEITNLDKLVQLDLGYNSLTTTDQSVIEFLNEKDPDWADTQN
jgi:Leucine-rich repeat (LRR) protein